MLSLGKSTHMYARCSLSKPIAHLRCISCCSTRKPFSQARAGRGGFVERHGILLDITNSFIVFNMLAPHHC